MSISRGQMPRQMYGLGSFVKSITKGAKSAVSSVKDLIKSDLGKAALLIGGGMYAGGLGPFAAAGRFGSLPGAGFASGIPGLIKSGISSLGLDVAPGAKPTLGQFAKVFTIGSLGGAALEVLTASGADEEELKNIRDVDTLKAYLRDGYMKLNPGASPMQVDRFVEGQTYEYRANGGRIGFADGMPREGIETLLPKPKPSEMMQDVDKTIQSIDNFAQLIAQSGSPSDMRGHMDLFSDFIQKNNVDAGPAFQYLKNRVKELKPGMERYIYISNEDMPVQKAMGGRIGFFKGAQADARAGRGAMSPGTSMSGGFRGGGDGVGNKDTTPKISEVVKNISNLSRVPAFEKISNLEAKYGLGSSGLPSRARHMAAMNVLSNALSKTGLGVAMGIPSKLAGDMGAFGMGLINEIPALGRGLTKENLSEIGEDIVDNFRGTVLTPNTMTTEQIYSNVYARPGVRQGGRIGFAFGNPEQNAMEASGIGGLPLNQNPAGITELDLRDNGGFIPPVGVKEKADDIPAMLSNNEFVFTADAVKGMGEGDVNVGAQRMYDMMKKLENGGRV